MEKKKWLPYGLHSYPSATHTSNLTNIYKQCGIPAHILQTNSMESQGIQAS
jgi:hypothetical protein